MIARGIALQNAARFKEAEYLYQVVLRANPKNADALNLMGTLAIEADRNKIARDYFTRALEQRPREPVYLNNMANALLLAGDAAAALPLFRKAVKQQPRYVEAVCNIGRAHRALAQADKARPFFEKALKLDPGFIRASLALAEMEAEVGNMEAALARFREVLAAEPGNVQALSGIAVTRRFEAQDPEPEMIANAIAGPELSTEHRALLHHAAGKICNDLERWEEAIGHFTKAKALKPNPFHMDLHRRTYARARELFTPAFFASRAGSGDPSEAPVFIVGMPRSGTTLTEQIVASHPQGHGAGELPDIRKIAAALKYGTPEPDDYAAMVSGIPADNIAALAKQYLSVLRRGAGSATRVSDKNPHNYEHLGLIALMFPNARIVHCLRDPVDTCVSCFMQPFAEGHAYNADLETLGLYYREYRGLMAHWREVLPLDILELRYEDMIADQEAQSRELIRFLGLDWDDACLRFFETERPVLTPSRWQVRQPIYATSVGRWKRYGESLAPLIEALGDLGPEGGAA